MSLKTQHSQAREHPVVYLDEYDLDFAEELTQKRESTYIKDGDHIYRSQNKAKTSYDQQSKSGILGEISMSKHVHGDYVGVDLHVWDEDGDGGVDMVVNGRAVDVKVTTYGARDPDVIPHLLVTEQNHWRYRDETDAYVLAVYDDVADTVTLRGWISHDEVAPVGEFVREGDSIVSDGTPILCRQTDYVVHPRHLRPMSEL